MDPSGFKRPHTMHVEYTVDDDGIWLRCDDCPKGQHGFKSLGFNPTADQITEAQQQHRRHPEQ